MLHPSVRQAPGAERRRPTATLPDTDRALALLCLFEDYEQASLLVDCSATQSLDVSRSSTTSN